jgi:monoamine oxidase
MDQGRVSVVVVGAGLSGMVAARNLRAAGLSVRVLEASARVGGRIQRIAGPQNTGYDGGGQFVDDPQVRIIELINELGLSCGEVSTGGLFVRIRNGVRSTEKGETPKDRREATQNQNALQRVVNLAAELRPDAPWTHPRAAEWDSMTFRTWTEANIASDDARNAVESLLMPTGPPTDVSLFHVLVWVRGHGDARNLHTSERYLVRGGTFQVPERLAADLGDVLMLETPVRAVFQDATGVRVISERIEIDADAAIVALAPPLVERIDFTPDLPARRRILQHRWTQMPSIKSIAVYEKPWWRERGFSGQAVTDFPVAPFIIDASDADGGPGVLVSFTNFCRRPPAWVVNDAARRRSQFFDTIAATFGAAPEEPTGYLEGNWIGRRWSYGCGQMLQCGVLSSFGDMLRTPADRVCWAGTEVAVGYAGYMEGAVRAGENAAAQAIALVGAPGNPSP